MRKLKLSPMQRDILWTLEEAGEETVVCLLATLHHPAPAAFHREVDILERLRLVARSIEVGSCLPSLVLTPEGRIALTR